MASGWTREGIQIEADNDDDDDGMNSGPTTSEEGQNWNQEAEPHTDRPDGRTARLSLSPSPSGRRWPRWPSFLLRRNAATSLTIRAIPPLGEWVDIFGVFLHLSQFLSIESSKI